MCQCRRGQGWKFSMLLPSLPAPWGQQRQTDAAGKVQELHAFCAGRSISWGPESRGMSPQPSLCTAAAFSSPLPTGIKALCALKPP